MCIKFYPSGLPLVASFLIILFPNPSLGQVIADGTLKTPTSVDFSENTYRITQGVESRGNLFHSFQDFSLKAGQTAKFENSTTVQNIITRITGKQISNIDGTISANGAANIFFLNPNGIIFGKNARLEIGGSFVATTANSIKFADNSQYGITTEATPPTLSVTVPTGLQFGNQANAIINKSVVSRTSEVPGGEPTVDIFGLELKPNQTLALVGGDIQIEGGHINALAGRIELVSVRENSLVGLAENSQGWQLGWENVTGFRDITISKNGEVNAGGAKGTINLQGSRIILSDGGAITNSVIPKDNQATGAITINAADLVQLIGITITGTENQREPPTQIQTAALLGTTSPTGKLTINTPKLILENGAVISIDTFGAGKGGELIINASESVNISGVNFYGSSRITSATFQPPSMSPVLGDGGNVMINTKRLTVSSGGQILGFTTSQGGAGTITINASESVLVIGQGLVQNINTLAPSQITTSSGLASLKLPGGGKAGDIQINTPHLAVENDGSISADSFLSRSAAGNITIRANTIVLNNRGELAAKSTSGTGGNIFIGASDSITLQNQGLITTEAIGAGGSGDGGNIELTTPFIFAVPNQNSDIKANAGQGNGGNVTINASGLFGIEPRPQSTPLSDITASSKTGLSGVIAINGAEVDPQSGLVNQDTDVVETKNLITQTCGTGGEFASGEFTITGRSGLPIDPNQITGIPQGLPDFGTPTPTEANLTPTKPPRKALPIVEAQGWTVNQVGEIVLVATAEPGNPLIPTSCLP